MGLAQGGSPWLPLSIQSDALIGFLAGLCAPVGEAAQPIAAALHAGFLDMTSYLLGMQPPMAQTGGVIRDRCLLACFG